MRACGPGEFRASLEAQLLVVARRLSHRVVAIGLFPPSSDSWHPTHSTHKFTRATASGESNFHRAVIGYLDHTTTRWKLSCAGPQMSGRPSGSLRICPAHRIPVMSSLLMRAVEPWRRL